MKTLSRPEIPKPDCAGVGGGKTVKSEDAKYQMIQETPGQCNITDWFCQHNVKSHAPL